MTKTERAIAERAARNGGTVQVEAGSGRGARGGRVSYGAREMHAALSLISQGKATEVFRDSSPLYAGGNCLHVTCITLKVA